MTKTDPTRPRGGQPKGELARTETIRVRFTAAERKAIEAAAAVRGESLSDYARGVLTRSAARVAR